MCEKDKEYANVLDFQRLKNSFLNMIRGRQWEEEIILWLAQKADEGFESFVKAISEKLTQNNEKMIIEWMSWFNKCRFDPKVFNPFKFPLEGIKFGKGRMGQLKFKEDIIGHEAIRRIKEESIEITNLHLVADVIRNTFLGTRNLIVLSPQYIEGDETLVPFFYREESGCPINVVTVNLNDSFNSNTWFCVLMTEAKALSLPEDMEFIPF